MAIFKREKCYSCGYKHNESKPKKANKPCPKCGKAMQYSENWYISYQVSGKKFIESVAPQKRIAEDALSKIKSNVRENKWFDKAPSTSWHDALDQFREWFNANLKPGSAQRYEYSFQQLTPHFEMFALDKISVPMVEQYKAKRSLEVKPATVNRDLAALKRLFSLAEEWGLVEVDKVRKVKLLKENNKSIRFLTEQEIELLLNECKNPLRLAVLLVLNTGLRREGVLSLKWTEIDFKRKVISKAGKGDMVVHIPLTSQLESLLKEYKKNGVVSQYLFPSPKNSDTPIYSLKKSFKTALKKAGIEDFTFHGLRHTFASHFLMRTGDLKTLQEILGHSDIKTTMRYSHLLNEHKKKAMKTFSGTSPLGFG